MYKRVYEKSDLLSVQDMAKEMGCNQQTIRRYINGENANGIQLIAEKLGSTAYTTRENFEKWKKEYTAWRAEQDSKRKKF